MFIFKRVVAGITLDYYAYVEKQYVRFASAEYAKNFQRGGKVRGYRTSERASIYGDLLRISFAEYAAIQTGANEKGLL